MIGYCELRLLWNAFLGKVRELIIRESPEIKAKFDGIGAEPLGTTPVELASYLNKEIERWGKVISTNNIKSD